MTDMEQYRSAAREIEQLLNRAFAPLRSGAAHIAELYEREAVDGRVTTEKLHALQPDIFRRLETVQAFYGTGFVADPSATLGGGLYEEWWFRAPESTPQRLSANIEYDYTKMDYFSRASQGNETIVGPYLDFTGADLFIFTLAVPVYFEDRFIGVSGADITVGALERLLLQVLEECSGETVLLNEEQRVVASTSDEYGPGDKLKQRLDSAVGIGGAGVDWKIAPFFSSSETDVEH